MESQFSTAFLALTAEPPTTPGADDQDSALYNEMASLAHSLFKFPVVEENEKEANDPPTCQLDFSHNGSSSSMQQN